jgi:hypothetical protein
MPLVAFQLPPFQLGQHCMLVTAWLVCVALILGYTRPVTQVVWDAVPELLGILVNMHCEGSG